MKDEPLTEEQGSSSTTHPSRNLRPRARGYGIGGGYEQPLRKRTTRIDDPDASYGPIPHSGYYGSGGRDGERFNRGHAGFNDELRWYTPQYGERTSGEKE